MFVCVYSIANIRIHVVAVALLIARIYLHAVPSCTRGDVRLSPIIVVSQLSRPYRIIRIFNIHARSTHTTCTQDIRNGKKKSSFATQPNLISQGRIICVLRVCVYTIMYILFAIRSCASLPRWMSGGHADGRKEKLILR